MGALVCIGVFNFFWRGRAAATPPTGDQTRKLAGRPDPNTVTPPLGDQTRKLARRQPRQKAPENSTPISNGGAAPVHSAASSVAEIPYSEIKERRCDRAYEIIKRLDVDGVGKELREGGPKNPGG